VFVAEFSLDGSTGVIRTTQSLDRETRNFYLLRVRADLLVDDKNATTSRMQIQRPVRQSSSTRNNNVPWQGVLPVFSAPNE
jgi:hypothetical protein